MIKNTRNTIVVFAFVAMLLAMPLSAGTAFATSGGDGVINQSCGITEPTLNLNLGAINKGTDGTTLFTSIATSGSETGTFEVKLNDWLGAGTVAQNSILVGTPVAGVDILDIDGNTYQAVSSLSVDGDFVVDANPITTASNLAAVITADARAGTQAGFDQTATAFDNAIFIRNNEVGATLGNEVVIAQTAGTGLPVQVAGGKLVGGEEAGTKHMDAEDTHYEISTDGTVKSGAYSAMTPLAAHTVNKVLSTTTDPGDQNIFLYLRLSGVDTSAVGSLTFTGIGDAAAIVVGDTTLTSNDAGATNDPLKFDTSGNEAADAAAFEAKLDAISQQFTTETVGAVTTITVIDPGEAGNSLTMTVPSGVTKSQFAGGDDNLENLPFNGAMTTTITYGTRC